MRKELLNANYSFKYFGKGQGVSAYSFIDERQLLWHSLVFSAAERESAYVIDGLMRNDVVKSDLHSTDWFRCVGWLQASSGPLPSDQTARPNTWWTRARCAGMSLAGTARTCPLASIAIASTPASVRRAVPKL